MAEDSFLSPGESEDDGESQGALAEVVESEEQEREEKAEPKKAEPKPAKTSAKPIPDKGGDKTKGRRAELPGVVKGGAESLFGKSARDGETGRFLAKMEGKHRAPETIAEVDDDLIKRPAGEAAPKTPVPATDKRAPADSPAKFKFAGEDFETQDQAEQSFKTLRGMYRPLKEKADQSDHNYTASQRWMDVTKQVLAGTASPETINALRTQLGVAGVATRAPQSHSGSQGAGSSNVAGILKDIDMGAFATIAADPDGGLEVAGRYLVQEVLNAVEEKLLPAVEQRIQGRVQPLLADREQSDLSRSAETLLEQMGNLVDPTTKEIAIPELRDPVAVTEIGRLWGADGGKAEELVTPRGLIKAVALYRFMNPHATSGASKATPTTRTELQGLPAGTLRRAASGAAASLSDDAGSGAGAAPQVRQGQYAGLIEALADTKLLDPVLGFKRNPRIHGVE